jgi:hypothetical protein
VTGERAILVTVTGPAGHADIGVRSDATPRQLAAILGGVIGLGDGLPAAEHRAPPRPGVSQGRRAPLRSDSTLAEAGVADGDLIVFSRVSASQPMYGHPGGSQAREPGRSGPRQPGEQRRSAPA